MKAYSHDLRQRSVHAVDQGHRQAEIAAAFQISVATIKRYREAPPRNRTRHRQAHSWPPAQATGRSGS